MGKVAGLEMSRAGSFGQGRLDFGGCSSLVGRLIFAVV